MALSEDARRRVMAARRGDRHAFAGLFAEFAPMVHGVLLSRVSGAEVEDLMQDVFVAAMERIGQLRDDGAFGSWLAAIARNRATDFHRTRKPMTELPEDLAAPSTDGGEARGDAARVLALVRTLPEAYREPLVLRLVEGMTGPEIAERVGLTPESVRVNLHRGMTQLRARLGLAPTPDEP
jgi:RNA polymerase sigma-70 factor, ECF subfamily